MSSDAAGQTADLQTAVSPSADGGAGVEAGATLRRFALAVVRRDEPELTRAREALLSEVPRAAVVEAACVVAQFVAVNRVADATGIVLDEMLEQLAPSVLEGVDLDHLRTD